MWVKNQNNKVTGIPLLIIGKQQTENFQPRKYGTQNSHLDNDINR